MRHSLAVIEGATAFREQVVAVWFAASK